MGTGRLSASLAAVLLLVGCTRVIDDARPQMVRTAAPITAGQVSDLLSEDAEPEPDPNLFATATPEKCAGLIREVDPPFIFGTTTPVAHDAEGWDNDEDDPAAFIAAHNAAIEITDCGEFGGYDVLTLATAALERINKLANMTT